MSKQERTPAPQAQDFAPPDPARGLDKEEVRRRVEAGLDNAGGEAKAKSTLQIIRENVFTLFNLLNFTLGFLVLLTGAYQNALFLGVVFFNLSIGVVNQLRAKRAVEKLSLLSKVQVRVCREGVVQPVDFEEVVLHDILLLEAGSQIPVDCELLEGDCEVDETMLTGEAEPVYKRAGDMLFSGSYVLSGRCRAMAVRVGAESYAAKIVNDSKKLGKVHSKLLDSMNRIISVLTVFIVIFGALLFLKEYFLLHDGARDSLLRTTAAVIGMIPEGLILLTNVALALGVYKLAQQNTLVQEMYSIETLARVNLLCIDKTGTITDGSLHLAELLPLEAEDEQAVRQALCELVWAVGDTNATAQAVRDAMPLEKSAWDLREAMNFSPVRKWSGADFAEHGAWILGAPEVLAADCRLPLAWQQEIRRRQAQGQRVLLLAQGEGGFSRTGKEASYSGALAPRAILAFEEGIRKESREIFRYMRQNGIAVKIISGDSAATVYAIAKKAGADCQGGYIDLFGMDRAAVEEAAARYAVFGRVSPQQKKWIVHFFRAQGRTVAMTGDGVNDVPALKEADCSITLRTGSDAARTISQIVLLDSNLYAIYHTILEGNRVVNNIQRSASLFLVKTIFSCALCVLFMLLPLSYPFVPVQLTLFSSLCIGIPSFLLTLQHNYRSIENDFFGPVLRIALPGGLGVAVGVLALCAVGKLLAWGEAEIALLCTVAAGGCGFFVLFQVMRPFCLWKRLVYATLAAAFGAAVVLFGPVFYLPRFTLRLLWRSLGVLAFVWPVNRFFAWLTEKWLRRGHLQATVEQMAK